MKIEEWLDREERNGADMSGVRPPAELLYDEAPDETVYFREFNPCSILCPERHPFSMVERFGRWYYCRGQDRAAGIHSSEMEWTFFTKDRNLAVETARSHIQTDIG